MAGLSSVTCQFYLQSFLVSLICLGATLSLDADYCESIYKTPENCTDDSDCDLQSILKWNDDNITIELRSKNGRSESGLKWLGIGFFEETITEKVDILVGWVADNDAATFDDRWLVNLLNPLYFDVDLGGTNDLVNTEGEYVNGVTVIKATRPQDTGDKYDITIGINKTQNVVYVIQGDAVIDSDSGSIQYINSLTTSGNLVVQSIVFSSLELCLVSTDIITTEESFAADIISTDVVNTERAAAMLSSSLASLLFCAIMTKLI